MITQILFSQLLDEAHHAIREASAADWADLALTAAAYAFGFWIASVIYKRDRRRWLGEEEK